MLKVDGKEVANQKIPHTIPFLMTIDETFDVGLDTRTPVDDDDGLARVVRHVVGRDEGKQTFD